jgi:hypothetical protein
LAPDLFRSFWNDLALENAMSTVRAHTGCDRKDIEMRLIGRI